MKKIVRGKKIARRKRKKKQRKLQFIQKPVRDNKVRKIYKKVI